MQTDLPKLPCPRVPGTKHAAFYGLILLLLWAAFWVESFNRGQLVAWRRVAFWAWSFVGLDFYHNHHAARAWLSGLNPYVDDFGDPRGPYAYPPVVLPMFAWCKLVGFQAGAAIWAGFIAAMVVWAARIAERSRTANGLPRLSIVFVAALLVWSMPVIFAMERGSGDVLVLVCMIGVVLAWGRRRALLTDIAIGACLAVAGWIKVYPLVLFGVLVLTSRWRGLLVGIAIFAAVGLVPLGYTKGFLAASGASQAQRTDTIGAAMDWLARRPVREIRNEYAPIEFSSHSLTTYWPALWGDLGLGHSPVPGLIAAGLCLFPLGAWVTWRFWRTPGRERWVFAFMLWIIAFVTFWMPVSYDYNLFFLPLAMWAVWDYRDGPISNLAMASAILWWQPLRLDALGPELLFFVKLASLIVAGQALVKRLREVRPVGDAAVSGKVPIESVATPESAPAPA